MPGTWSGCRPRDGLSTVVADPSARLRNAPEPGGRGTCRPRLDVRRANGSLQRLGHRVIDPARKGVLLDVGEVALQDAKVQLLLGEMHLQQ